MDKQYYKEMILNLEKLIRGNVIEGKVIFLFGHCNATEKLADSLLKKGYSIAGILDNNADKHGNNYRGILIDAPQKVLSVPQEDTVVCIVARAYAAMSEQLKQLGYKGEIYKLADYNSYAEYSLSKETFNRMNLRVTRGIKSLEALGKKHKGYFRVLCPFSALGDIYIMMSYLPYFLQRNKIRQCLIGIVGSACAEVVKLFGDYEVEIFSQKEMDETIQAALYTRDKDTFIPHQDRPYVVNLHKALYIKRLSLETMYCCGVFGLPMHTEPYKPYRFRDFSDMGNIKDGKAVILSPYAKSVTNILESVWRLVIEHYVKKGYQCFTNVAKGEKALPGTVPISPTISEIRSVVERAGTFIGIRSGLCDVIKDASCRKIALYPDYNYCDTRWKAVEIYGIDGWENIVVKEGFKWKRS